MLPKLLSKSIQNHDHLKKNDFFYRRKMLKNAQYVIQTPWTLLKYQLVKPPASLVFQGTVPFVVIVVPVVGAELDTLMAGPVGHAHLIGSR